VTSVQPTSEKRTVLQLSGSPLPLELSACAANAASHSDNAAASAAAGLLTAAGFERHDRGLDRMFE
jgi:hypothetical protein